MKQPKIKLWKTKDLFEKLTVPQIAVIYNKFALSYETFEPEKKYGDKEVLLFNKTAFMNAFKQITGKKVSELKKSINSIQHSIKTDQKEFKKQNKAIGKILDKAAEGFDKFELMFDDLIFSPKSFEDETMKKIIAAKEKAEANAKLKN